MNAFIDEVSARERSAAEDVMSAVVGASHDATPANTA